MENGERCRSPLGGICIGEGRNWCALRHLEQDTGLAHPSTLFDMARKGLIGAVVVPAAVAAGVVVGLPRLLQKKFAPPRREQPHRPEELGLDAEEFFLTAIDGSRLRAWYVGRSRPSPVLIVLHGWGSNSSLMLPVAPVFHDAGYGLLFVDARSHGGSDEVDHMSMPRFAQDLDVAIDWVRERPDVTGVAVLGHSIGAGAVILSTSRRDDVNAAIAVGAFSHPWELIQRVPQINALPGAAQWAILRTIERNGGFRMDDVAPRTRVGMVRCPLMLVHGGNDEVISHEDFDELSRLSPVGSESLLVPGAVHDRLDEYVPELPHVLGFLAKHVHRPRNDEPATDVANDMPDYAALRAEKHEFFAHDDMSPFEDGEFEGLKWFDPNPDLVFTVMPEEADGSEVTMATSSGSEQAYRTALTARLELAGEEVTLTLFSVPGYDHWFLPFRDRTSGKETYGAGRYLDVPPNDDGTITIDFNLAYNPSCAYDDGWTCPLPPAGNWLQVPIEAGEKSYR